MRTGNHISRLHWKLGGTNRLEWDLITFAFQLLQRNPRGSNLSDPAARYIKQEALLSDKGPEGAGHGDAPVNQVDCEAKLLLEGPSLHKGFLF